MNSVLHFWRFIDGSARVVARGNAAATTRGSVSSWRLIVIGVLAFGNQTQNGLIVSNMRDQVSWGFYIGNFAFLVGVAAAAVILVIPAYVYRWGPIKEVVILGEILAVSAIIMCMLFVAIDVGRPDRFWHLFPGAGTPHFPSSLLVWDILVLNVYFVINLFVVTYLVFKSYMGQQYNVVVHHAGDLPLDPVGGRAFTP